MPERRGLFRFIVYAMVGAVGTLAQYVILVTAVSLHWSSPVVASVIGALVGGIINYLLNARITFRSRSHASSLPKFALIALLGAAVSGIMMKTLIDLAGLNYLFAQVIATVVVLGLTYSLNLLWTFRHKAEEPDLHS
jgi:putative flippase GtrA